MWRSLPWAAHQAIAEALMRENIRTIVFISLSKLRCSQAGPRRSRSRGRTAELEGTSLTLTWSLRPRLWPHENWREH